MEVDKTIDIICGLIQQRIEDSDMDTTTDVAKLTSALAQLVSARAKTY